MLDIWDITIYIYIYMYRLVVRSPNQHLVKWKFDKEAKRKVKSSDSLQTFHTWKEPEKILDECQVIVALRPGFLPSDISNRILRKVRFASIPRFEIDSSTIRSRWRENKTIRYMVTQPVWEYINDHGIYQ